MPGVQARRRRPTGRVLALGLLVGVVAIVGAGLLAAGPGLDKLLAVGGRGGSRRRTALRATSRSPTPSRGSCPRSSRSRRATSSASGFVAAEKGLILTASHVVGRAQSVTLKLSDGSEIKGTVAAVDKTIDTAVVRAEREDLVPLQLGALADVKVGQTAIAIGSPFGFSQTVTTGIVSALGRTVPTDLGELHDLIQTDASINSGNSGGPLTDREGKAIGINTAIASAGGGSDGVGFAIPIDQAKTMLDKVRDGSWSAEDDNPPDDPSALGGLQDLLGPGLGDLFGPNGPLGDLFGNPSDPGQAPSLDELGPLLDDLFRALGPEFSAPAPDPTPEPDATPAPTPDAQADPGLGSDILDQLMRSLLDQLLDPSSGFDPFGTTPSGAQGVHP